MPRVFLAPLGPLLLVLHALVAVVLGGAGVHQAVLAVRILRGRAVSPRLLRVYSLVAALAYAATLLTGGLLYPRYRYFVRGLQLDRDAPWAANLFDFKENLATLGLPLAVGTLILASGVAGLRAAPAGAGSDDAGAARHELARQLRWVYGFFALGTAAVSLFNVIAGLIVTGVRGG
ncbi:MAG: hypothetical protein U1A78_03980 [Polyangia bacterium]